MKNQLFITIVLVSGEILCGVASPNVNKREAAEIIAKNCGYSWQSVKTFKETKGYGKDM
ncbi:MAG: hypothetical protein RRY36_09485 [Bacteroidaceae bacterium]